VTGARDDQAEGLPEMRKSAEKIATGTPNHPETTLHLYVPQKEVGDKGDNG